MSLDEYKLSCELLGHSLDVRAVADGNDCILSGSRDKTVKIWNTEGSSYIDTLTLSDHKNFVSTVYFNEDENWICSGSNDSTVCVYNTGSCIPFTVLTGHTSTVCSISKGLISKTLVTGSWDKTAIVWLISETNEATAILKLEGHDAAVWSVGTLKSGRFITGSADKMIFVWNQKGEKVRVLKGHTDCVRGLIGLDNGGLLSCGNDAAIRVWNEDGECIKELHGHSNYIYTISLNKSLGNDVFVTGSEDNTIRMWSASKGGLGAAIHLPAQSVWSVCCLKNGDIVTGTSDGVVRVFTKEPTRFADESLLSAFNKSVATRKAEASLELGGVKVNELPGPESLLQDGEENQTKIVRHPDGKILCYQWSNKQWNCLGDVTGASGGSQESSGKTLFEGKEYDYVFSVDISESAPAIKLPYNDGEDPFVVAQDFIHKNMLPQEYLEQVANFIMQNAKNAGAFVPEKSDYQDPFTGGGRYIPGSGDSNFGNAGGNVDPFTGASSYSTQASNVNVDFRPMSKTAKHFPNRNYITLDACDPSKVLIKLKEFNSKVNDVKIKMTDEVLDRVIKLTEAGASPDTQSIDSLKNLLKWPKDILFPVLDITRLAVREQTVCSLLGSFDFISLIIENVNLPPANQLMSIRCLVNMMNHGWGRGLIESRLPELVVALQNIKQGSVNLQLAISSFYLNITISQLDLADSDSCKLITEGMLDFLLWANDFESIYRSYQGLGNLSCTSSGEITLVQISSVSSVAEKIKLNSLDNFQPEYQKLNLCAKSLCELLI